MKSDFVTDFKTIPIYLILLAGLTLVIIQYLFNRSLWHDESLIALNLMQRDFYQLLKPLDNNQVAPILFLWFEKFFILLIPDSEFGLRLFPLVSYFFALFFYYRLLKKAFSNSFVILVALSLFVFNPNLIRFSSETKQYMTDVMVLTGIYYFLLKDYETESRRLLMLGLAGVSGIFLSNICIIGLLAAGTYLLFKHFIEKKSIREIPFVLFTVWGLSFLLYYIFFIHNHPTKAYMLEWWMLRKAFMPLNPFSEEFHTFIFSRTKMIFNSLIPTGKYGLSFLGVFFFAGIFYLLKKKNVGILILTLLPILVHFALSSFYLYPVGLRLVLYFLPLVIIIIGYGFEYLMILSTKFLGYGIQTHIPVVASLIFVMLFFQNSFPIKVYEFKESLNYIKQTRKQNEKIYIDLKTEKVFRYYKQINKVTLPDSLIIIGNKKDRKLYETEFEKLHGKYWLLFTLISPGDQKFIINRLKHLGYNNLDEFKTTGSSAYLFDFGN